MFVHNILKFKTILFISGKRQDLLSDFISTGVKFLEPSSSVYLKIRINPQIQILPLTHYIFTLIDKYLELFTDDVEMEPVAIIEEIKSQRKIFNNNINHEDTTNETTKETTTKEKILSNLLMEETSTIYQESQSLLSRSRNDFESQEGEKGFINSFGTLSSSTRDIYTYI